MSQPTRYRVAIDDGAFRDPWMKECEFGCYVKYSDYELLRQEFSLLAEERYTTIRALELEVERLRKGVQS